MPYIYTTLYLAVNGFYLIANWNCKSFEHRALYLLQKWEEKVAAFAPSTASTLAFTPYFLVNRVIDVELDAFFAETVRKSHESDGDSGRGGGATPNSWAYPRVFALDSCCFAFLAALFTATLIISSSLLESWSESSTASISWLVSTQSLEFNSFSPPSSASNSCNVLKLFLPGTSCSLYCSRETEGNWKWK